MFYCKSQFGGGYVFRNFQGTPKLEIENISLPHCVVLPLSKDIIPTVQVGQNVKAGEIIGAGENNLFTSLIASISGIIQKITEITYRGQNVKAIVIESNGENSMLALQTATSDWQKLSREEISNILLQSGVSSLGLDGIPTLGKTSCLDANQVQYLVIQALLTYPMAPKMISMCERRLNEAVAGISILRHFYGNPNTYVGYSKNEPEVGQALSAGLDPNGLVIQALVPRYPQEFPESLTQTLTGKEIPDGLAPNSIGAVVLSLSDGLAVYDAVVLGHPLISRMIALCGTGFAKNVILKTQLGTNLYDILRQYARPDHRETRLLLGTALLGEVATSDMMITAQDDCLTCLEEERHRQFLAFLKLGLHTDSHSNTFLSNILPLAKKVETNMHGEGRQCIHCSYCEDVCPCHLYPHLLHKYCTHDLAEEALGLRLKACIECGLCSYVCPSKIPILQHIQKGKQELRQAGLME